MEQGKPIQLSCNNVGQLKPNKDDKYNFLLRKSIGSLLYISTKSRPDKAQDGSITNKYIEHPNNCDKLCEDLKVFKYLASSSCEGIL